MCLSPIYADTLLKLPNVRNNTVFLEFMEVDQNIGEEDGVPQDQQAGGVSNQEDDSIAMEVERLKQIVESVSKSVINISQSEQLASHQARRRQAADILSACGGFDDHGEQLQELAIYQMPIASAANSGNEVQILAEPAFSQEEQEALAQAAEEMQKQVADSTAINVSGDEIIGRLSCMK